MSTTLNYNIVLSAYDHYPAPIRPYLLRAETHPTLRQLMSKSFLRIIIDILSRAPIKDPLRPLFFRVDVIAADLDVHTRTVTRALNFMRQKGWLLRAQESDGRNNWGEFCAGQYILGTELRSMLGLPIASTHTVTNNTLLEENTEPSINSNEIVKTKLTLATVDNYEVKTKMSDGYYKVNKDFKKEASFKNQNQTNNAKIPIDLQCLQDQLGITPFGICKLMQLARKTNQRLQDIWLVKRDQFLNAQVTGGRAFNYIMFLLNCKEDFAFLARQKSLSQKKIPQSLVPTMASKQVDVRIYFNRKFCGNNGLRITIHEDGSASVTDSTRNENYVRPFDMPPIYEAIRTGKLWLMEE